MLEEVVSCTRQMAMDSSGQATKHSKEDEERFARLFEQLDRNRDGKLDLQELREGIERLGLPSESGTAQVGRRPLCNVEVAIFPTKLSSMVSWVVIIRCFLNDVIGIN